MKRNVNHVRPLFRPARIAAYPPEPRASQVGAPVHRKLAAEALCEQRRRRRWGIFFKFVAVLYFGLLIATLYSDKLTDGLDESAPHVALVNLEGEIGPDGEASAKRINASLRAAFDNDSAKAVLLRINSPGGSPVQSALINEEMTRLRAAHPDKPLYAVVEEICASGGYYVAVAADQIYVSKASLVGSIGVIMNGFGFTGTMDKLGVERRLITAGENKGFLDPFSAPVPFQEEYARTMLADIHQQFIDAVKEGRGERLKNAPELFSGLVWTGQKGVELGLADGFGSVQSVARDVVKLEDIRDYTQEDSFAERFAK
ncbi:MAG: S49 family peptidase, partial [Limnobacter sp.]|nr:S49 family peptidase [Limnobacter sp.]